MLGLAIRYVYLGRALLFGLVGADICVSSGSVGLGIDRPMKPSAKWPLVEGDMSKCLCHLVRLAGTFSWCTRSVAKSSVSLGEADISQQIDSSQVVPLLLKCFDKLMLKDLLPLAYQT